MSEAIKNGKMVIGDLVPQHNETWVFFEDPKLAKYAYMNPDSLNTPENVITTYINNSTLERLVSEENTNRAIQVANYTPDTDEGISTLFKLKQPN